jgi:hypothetical protein
MTQQDRLSMLEVSPARHGNTSVLLGLAAKRIDVILQLTLNQVGCIEQEGPNQGCDLIISASACTNLSRYLCAGNLD